MQAYCARELCHDDTRLAVCSFDSFTMQVGFRSEEEAEEGYTLVAQSNWWIISNDDARNRGSDDDEIKSIDGDEFYNVLSFTIEIYAHHDLTLGRGTLRSL